jgi:hypothetical protein
MFLIMHSPVYISPDRGYIDLPPFYLGWNNVAKPANTHNPNDCGDEQFGIALFNLYAGVYSDGWSFGILNEDGSLE